MTPGAAVSLSPQLLLFSLGAAEFQLGWIVGGDAGTGDESADGAAEVALPTNAGFAGQHPVEHPTVVKHKCEADEDLGEAAVEDAANDQVGEPAKDNAGGANVGAADAAEEPLEGASNDGTNDGDFPEHAFAGPADEEGTDYADAGVADKVFPTAVEEGRGDDVPKGGGVPRVDAKIVEVVGKHEGVNNKDDPNDDHESDGVADSGFELLSSFGEGYLLLRSRSGHPRRGRIGPLVGVLVVSFFREGHNDQYSSGLVRNKCSDQIRVRRQPQHRQWQRR